MSTNVYTIAWNERELLPHFFKHYSFADKITVFDNGSTDGSQEIVVRLGGELRHYFTNGEQDNEAMRAVKCECWKDSKADWVIVCDMDEFIVGSERLAEYNPADKPVFLCEAWNMICEAPPVDFSILDRACRATWFDKCLCFPPTISEINYEHGCHKAHPAGGTIVPGVLKLYHFNMLGEDYVVKRWKRYVPRMSKNDIDHQWGFHYLQSEESIRRMWRQGMHDAVHVPPIGHSAKEHHAP
jgi:glycosyltransferase involved in cell wall biosynthesis